MSAETVKQFFNHVVVIYNCGDIRALLDAKLGKAGPLLSCVVNGLDLVGGMMLGFNAGSQKRSVEFMTKYMKLPPELAKLLYSLVRCGVAHEGTTKLAINYFVYPGRLDPGNILYKSTDNSLWLNVTEMAVLYLEAIADISKDVAAHLAHIPSATAADEADFANALGHIKPDITDFCRLAAEARDAPGRERFERGEIAHMSSASPFLADWLARFTVAKK
jgi:hypothetical protein